MRRYPRSGRIQVIREQLRPYSRYWTQMTESLQPAMVGAKADN